ncbi:hypothetical protein HDU83_002046 [Entophlyctis luteolus]|nr:hypothetical protein HDU83_002046 [Entophlyctis luteolus]
MDSIPEKQSHPMISGIGSTADSVEASAHLLSFPFQNWLTPLMRKAARRPLEFTDLYRLLNKYETDGATEKLSSKASKKARIAKSSANLGWDLFLVCVQMYPYEMIWGFIFHMVSAVTNIAAPIIMSLFLTALQSEQGKSRGYFLSAMFLVNQLGNAIGWNTSQYFMRGIAMSVRSSMSSLIFQKSLTMSGKSKLKFSNGRVFNLIASDCSNLENLFRDIHAILALPIQAIGLAVLAVVYLGLAGGIGMIFLTVGISVNSILMSKVVRLERRALAATDARVKLMNEILNAMKIVKLFGWEKSFTERVKAERDTETKNQKTIRLITAVFTMVINILPTLTNLIIFGLYFAFGNTLTPSTVFTALTIVNMIRLPVTYIPFVFQLGWSGWVSYDRIAEFLLLPDRENMPTIHGERHDENSNSIVIRDGNFQWPQPDSGNTLCQLKNVNLAVKNKSLVVVVGKVAAGKSSLLHAILGDMVRESGSIDIFGKIAYSSQAPWLQSASIRDNILFGAPFDANRYEETLRACCLKQDLELFAGGDLSEIGEKGVTLSGGQAARVALARAVYSDKDILLLDDPLAAVDSHVGRKLFQDCIMGVCKNKTVVLVTHQLHVTQFADWIVVLQDGEIVEQGTHEDLLASKKVFSAMIGENLGSFLEDEGASSKSLLKGGPHGAEISSMNTSKNDTPQAIMTVEERAVGRVESRYYVT